jgi:predicted DCC family thiol-disulfide oxidoreductase YuxK
MTQAKARLQVSNPPARPILVYDGQCGFCLSQVARLRRHCGNAVDFIPSDAPELPARFPELPARRFEESLQFVDGDGTVYAGLHGALKALGAGGRAGGLLRFYERNRGWAALLECGYRVAARNRALLSRFSRPGRKRRAL